MTSSPRLAIVTGGAGLGLGSGISRALARDGWDVLIADLDEDASRQLVQDLTAQGHAARSICVDLTSPDGPQRVVEAALAWRSRIDGLVNNAGIGLTKPFTQITDEEFDRLMATNLRAVFRLSRQVLQAITKPGGAIVNVASVHGRQPMPQFSVYAASKGAIEALTRGMAVDHGPEGVRVNCIIPGMVDCPQTRQVMGRVVPDVEAYLKQWISRNQLLPQLVTNDNVGDLVAFLLGPKSQGITAQSIIIDAGTLTQMVDRDG